MKFKCFLTLILGMFIAVTAMSADKLAIAEPVGKGGVKAVDIEAFWGILEASIQSDEYRLISRGALKQIMTEIGLTTSSDLLNLNSTQKAKLGQIEGVKYILVAEIGKFGTRYNCTMKILDSSTGEIDQARTANLRVKDFDELADKIEATLQTMLSDNKKLNRSAVLYPVVMASGIPSYLPMDICVTMENTLLNNGVRLQNLQSVNKILKKNNLDALGELEPKMYVKVGKLLEVKYIIRTYITDFKCVKLRPFVIRETGRRVEPWDRGELRGYVRVIEAASGEPVASFELSENIQFRLLDRQMTRYWQETDYAKYLVKCAVARTMTPELFKKIK